MFTNLLSVMLQAGAPGMGGSTSLLFMGGMVVVMYFFMIRPQQKRAKDQKKFSETIAPGEKIITTAGIHATITRANEDNTLQIEVSRGNFMVIERSAVSMELTEAYRKKNAAPAVTEAKAVAAATK